jgi:hypothetical protein
VVVGAMMVAEPGLCGWCEAVAGAPTVPPIEVRVWGYLEMTLTVTSRDKSGYRRFLGGD